MPITTKFRVMYRKLRVTVEGVRPEVCAACRRKGRIELHHWKYAYSTSEVRLNPQLALDFTIGLCYQCHKIADYIRNILENRKRFNRVMVALSRVCCPAPWRRASSVSMERLWNEISKGQVSGLEAELPEEAESQVQT